MSDRSCADAVDLEILRLMRDGLPDQAIAQHLAFATATSAHAEQDAVSYADADWSVAPKDTWGGKGHFQAYGEHLFITDLSKDGHSVVVEIQYPGGGTQYWWTETVSTRRGT